MAHFYGDMQGNRGEATRMGTKNSGITAHIRGWGVGVRVICGHTDKTGKDECYVYQTGGSRGATSDKLIKVVKDKRKS